MKKQKKEIGYKINRIITTEFSFTELDDVDLDKLFTDDSSLKIKLNVNSNIDKDLNTISFEIESSLFDSENDIEIIHHKGKTVYKIEGLEQTYVDKKDSFDLPDNLIVQLFSISFTHARALLSIELSPTIYKNRYFLPIIDPTSILNNE